MNNFYEKQNNNDLLSLLKLQRYRYNQISIVSTLNFVMSVIVPIILSMVGLLKISQILISYLNYIGAICTTICLVLTYKIKTMKENAAKVQYLFDVNLFGIKKNELICNLSLTEMLALSKEEKIQKLEGLENWYSIKSNININDAIFSCQKQNIRWDNSLRKKFIYCNITICVLSIFAITSIAILNNLEFTILWSYIFLLMPIITYYIIFFLTSSDNIKSQNELNQIFNDFKMKNNISIQELSALEEKIYLYRKELIKIPNWFFKIFRKSMQKEADNYSIVEGERYKNNKT